MCSSNRVCIQPRIFTNNVILEKTYAGKKYPSRSDFDFDDGSLAIIWNVASRDIHIHGRKGARPTRDIFDRAVARSRKGVVGDIDVDVFSSAMAAAEDLASKSIGQAAALKGPTTSEVVIDIYALAGDVAYYAEGVDVFRGFRWQWHDGGGDTIERILYSAAETEAAAAATQQQQQQQQQQRVIIANDSEECAIPRASVGTKQLHWADGVKLPKRDVSPTCVSRS